MRFISEKDLCESTGGRRAARLVFFPESRFSFCMDLSHTNFLVASLMDLENNILSRRQVPIGQVSSIEKLTEFGLGAYSEFTAERAVKTASVIGMGVAIPGTFDPNTGRVTESSYSLITRVRLQERMENDFSIPVIIENDANSAALAQSISFKPEVKNMLFLYFSKGIGMGIVIDGQIYKGRDGMAGELGHLKVTGEDFTCECGQRGCFRVVTLTNLLRRYFGSSRSIDEIASNQRSFLGEFISDYQAEKQNAVDVLDDAGEIIGNVIGSLSDIFNPDVIVLSGNISPIFDQLLPLVREQAKRRSFIANEVDLRILGVKNDRELILKGCGESVFQHWLQKSFVI
jgi:predicted NBD/HSP70 family sugar kinase